MLRKILIVLLSVCAKAENSTRIITTKYYSIFHHYYIKFYLGTPAQTITKSINQNLPHTWLAKTAFEPKDSNTSQILGSETIKISQQDSVPAKKISDVLCVIQFSPIKLISSFNSTDFCYNISNYNFYSTEIKEVNSDSLDSGVSFSYGIDEKFSIVHGLFNSGLIGKRSYSIFPSEISSLLVESKLFFGGIPKEALEDFKDPPGHCNINQEVSSWECQGKKMIFDGHEYSSNFSVMFQVKTEYIYVPDEFWNFMKNAIFKKYFDNKKCHEREYSDKVSIVCRELSEKDFKPLTIVIEDFQYTLKPKMLFREFFRDLQLLMVKSKTRNDKLILGAFFSSRFLTEFDYDNKKVTLYSKVVPIVPFQGGKINVGKKFLLVVSISMSLFGILLSTLPRIKK